MSDGGKIITVAYTRTLQDCRRRALQILFPPDWCIYVAQSIDCIIEANCCFF